MCVYTFLIRFRVSFTQMRDLIDANVYIWKIYSLTFIKKFGKNWDYSWRLCGNVNIVNDEFIQQRFVF